MIDTNSICRHEDIAAYLDGELAGDELAKVEAHLKSCAPCARELRTQRELLCTLDAAFGGSPDIDLPHDFTRVVATHAESEIAPMHTRAERWRALRICLVLAISSSALLGATARTLIFEPVRSFLHLAQSVLDLASRTGYDAAIGATVIGRVAGQAVISAPYRLGLLLLFAFIVSISLLPLLIARYHRADI